MLVAKHTMTTAALHQHATLPEWPSLTLSKRGKTQQQQQLRLQIDKVPTSKHPARHGKQSVLP
jgi:hypothetical protein